MTRWVLAAAWLLGCAAEAPRAVPAPRVPTVAVVAETPPFVMEPPVIAAPAPMFVVAETELPLVPDEMVFKDLKLTLLFAGDSEVRLLQFDLKTARVSAHATAPAPSGTWRTRLTDREATRFSFQDGCVKIWRLGLTGPPRQNTGACRTGWLEDLDPANQRTLFVDRDGHIVLHEAGKQRRFDAREGGAYLPTRVRLDRSGRYVFTNTGSVWEADDGSSRRMFAAAGSYDLSEVPVATQLSPTGETVALTAGRAVVVRRVETGDAVWWWHQGTRTVTAWAFAADDRMLVASDNGDLWHVSPRGGELLRLGGRHQAKKPTTRIAATAAAAVSVDGRGGDQRLGSRGGNVTRHDRVFWRRSPRGVYPAWLFRGNSRGEKPRGSAPRKSAAHPQSEASCDRTRWRFAVKSILVVALAVLMSACAPTRVPTSSPKPKVAQRKQPAPRVVPKPDPRAAAYDALARDAYERGALDVAARGYELAYAAEPRPERMVRRAFILRELGDDEAALAVLRSRDDLDPSLLRALETSPTPPSLKPKSLFTVPRDRTREATAARMRYWIVQDKGKLSARIRHPPEIEHESGFSAPFAPITERLVGDRLFTLMYGQGFRVIDFTSTAEPSTVEVPEALGLDVGAVVAVGLPGRVALFDHEGKRRGTLFGEQIEYRRIKVVGDYVAAASNRGHVAVWERIDGRLLWTRTFSMRAAQAVEEFAVADEYLVINISHVHRHLRLRDGKERFVPRRCKVGWPVPSSGPGYVLVSASIHHESKVHLCTRSNGYRGSFIGKVAAYSVDWFSGMSGV